MNRRNFLNSTAAALASTALASEIQQKPNQQDAIDLPALHNTATEGPEKSPVPAEAPSSRVGYAIVGLGDLALKEILPAFGSCKYSKPVALVSGDAAKAGKIADQYGIKDSAIYNYRNYDDLAKNSDVQAIYIVLPNSQHAEFTERGAKAGKHILCEKPMATSVRDCERMIAACAAANVKLMIAYRQQYEPMNRAVVKMVRDGKLGPLRSFIATHSQNQGDPNQWRQKLALAGGGCLPDVGIYCLNAARFLSGEEPTEVWGTTFQPKDDSRFAEVEATCSFTLRFPSGLLASCNTGYAAHNSGFFRLEGASAWAELNPAFPYNGLKLLINRLEDGHNTLMQPTIKPVDQFAAEIDHMSVCIQNNLQPHTPGEEGLQDQRIVEAIYRSAKTGNPVKLSPPPKPTRGPDPIES